MKKLIVLLVTLYFFNILLHPTDWHFIDSVNLIFHEAGHPLMMFFGEFFHAAGGTIFQIGIPLCITLYFWKREEFFSASLVLFWVGQNFINVSVYARDAITQSLPLLGGDAVQHDWTGMLTMLGILKYTPAIADILFYCGASTMLIALYFSLHFSKKEVL
jgi:hypothetical protein